MGFFKKSKPVQQETRSLVEETGFEMFNNSLIPVGAITGSRAIENSDIRKAIDTIANDVSNLEINTVRKGQILEVSSFDYLLNVRPHELYDAKSFWYAITSSMLRNGNGYAEIIRDKEGRPIAFQHLPIESLTINFDSNYGNRIESYTHNGEKGLFKFKPEDILHFKISPLDGLVGVSPLRSLVMEIDLLNRGNKSLLAFYNRSIKGSGKVTFKNQKGAGVNLEAANKLRQRFVELNNPSNEEALGLIMVEEGLFDYSDIPMDTGFLDLINNITFEQKQIAKVFSIPLEKFGMEAINSSSRELNSIYFQEGLKNYLRAIEAELNLKLGDRELSFKYDTSELTAYELKERIESLSVGVKSGFLTPNEVRKELGYSPQEGGDSLVMNAAFKEKGEEQIG